jgi:3-dehydroquinate synthase
MRISLTKFQCNIVLANPDLACLSEFLLKNKSLYTNCVVISDENVFHRFGNEIKPLIEGQGLSVHPIVLKPGEPSKTLDSVIRCWQEMQTQGSDRSSLVIGFGGGMVTDVAGFASACYMRGVDTVYIPTTLLGMVDAAIGGKSGVNLCKIKNLVGTLKHPRLVVVAPHYLKTLPPRELSSGLAEIIKAGMIWDGELFEFLEKHMEDILAKNPEKLKTIITKACKIKTDIVRADEKEHNVRAILNYGHTFAHAIEALTNYELYTHGEAVSIGMSCAAKVSRILGYVDDEFVKRQDNLCASAQLPVHLPPSICPDDMLRLMLHDKKTVKGKIKLIIPRRIGKVDQLHDVDPAVLCDALKLKGQD